jgi:undecaprenyl-diphosphatase
VATAATQRVAPDGSEATQGSADLGTKLRKGIGFESHRFSLLVDGRHYRVSAWQVMAVNTGVVGSELLRAGPPIHPTDGTAELVVLQIRGAMDLFRSALGLLGNGRGEQAIDISYHRTRQNIAIIPDSPMPVQGDGEAIGTTPIEIEVVPGAVRVIVPKAAPVLAPGVVSSAEELGHHRRKAGWFRAALLHRLGPLGALDTALYIAVSRMPHPPFLNFLMQSLEVGMASGRGWIAGVVAANLLRGRRPWKDLVNLVPSLWISSLLTEFPIKEVFARPRPFASVVMMPVVGRKPSSHSFPSGHSASAFAGAWLLSRRHPRLSPAFYAFAILVAFSRVYQGVHYPSDVAIGAATGTGLAALYRVTLGDLIRRVTRKWA